jgi:hypothetical protein
MPRGASVGYETFDHLDDLVGTHGTSHLHGEGLSGVLVHNVEQLQTPLIGGLVELEVQSPHMVRCLGSQQEPVRGPRPAPLGPLRRGTSQAFVAPQTP